MSLLSLSVCLQRELLKADLPLLCLPEGFVSVLTTFDLQGLRLKFVSPWRLHVMSLNPATFTHYLFHIGKSVLVWEQLHVLCLFFPQPQAKQNKEWTLRIRPVHKVFVLGDSDVYLLSNFCISVLRILASFLSVTHRKHPKPLSLILDQRSA